MRVSLEDDIFEAWSKSGTLSPQIMSDLRGAFGYRHWLAHGRYWFWKSGRRYDYQSVYELAYKIFDAFPSLII